MVAVVGVAASAQANLLAEIDALGTNLLTVTPGQNFLGNDEVLPATSVPMIDHMQHVLSDAAGLPAEQRRTSTARRTSRPSRRVGSASTPPAMICPGWLARRSPPGAS